MIQKVIIRNFKKFGNLEFDLSDHIVIAGPNNSGKTSILQAIATWSELASQWLKKSPTPEREEDGNYPSLKLNLFRFYCVPLVNYDHLWHNKDVQESIVLWLHTTHWKVGFELIYHYEEIALIRPVKVVDEIDLKKFLDDPISPIYIPPHSGIDTEEPPYDDRIISPTLAKAQPGKILRNLVWIVGQDKTKWETLKDLVRSFFGYELDDLRIFEKIVLRYRHWQGGPMFDLSSAASGFLQVLMVFSALLYKESSVVLIDEPDAHLHILLQGKMYQNLQLIAKQNNSQLIIATHSERMINATPEDSLRLISDDIYSVPNKRKVLDTLYFENVEIYLAHVEPGILYVEGQTDLLILQKWSQILEHPLSDFLEHPFSWQTAQHEWKAPKHFSALRLMVPDFCGAELCDSNGRDRNIVDSLPTGMIRLYWDRYEIENYLVHPTAIYRFVEYSFGIEMGIIAQTVTCNLYDFRFLVRIFLAVNQFVKRLPNCHSLVLLVDDWFIHASINLRQMRIFLLS
ncbi:MAG: AAA family ATPase [Bacteroidetes bacterium]|nr:AAA family ATPase [Bacteroidota bacterium]